MQKSPTHFADGVEEATPAEAAIFNADDYRNDDPAETPPRLWDDAKRVIPLGADAVAVRTVAIPQYHVGALGPTMLVPRDGNNSRKRAILRNISTVDVWLVTDDATPISASDPVAYVPNGFLLAAYDPDTNTALHELIYEAVAPLYAVNVGETTDVGLVSVLIEQFFPSTSR